MAKLTTAIADVPVANDRIYEELSKLNKMPKSKIKEMIEFVGSYTAEVIKSGNMEDVMIPYFGKFQVKKARQYCFQTIKASRRNGTNMLRQAAIGKKVIDYRKKKDDNETI